ncbi:hypothetical protein BST22_20165 [Mycolicibacterium chubuense]|uniref:Uncharacterized protein n=1 Tax=Mycolicibacterium chubuense TaxID=1800 RepID=A0A0J6WEJ0_MYCCU|nr:hypothetical protein MCHUDSM44219_01984 [Mycolicibacterium chubuense]ORA47289.1 hypothetical protein BST22_20165 [Mycolicibacterium chubuense]SPY00835.1 Uncharacterised protein [Mycolicibacterium chubuense]
MIKMLLTILAGAGLALGTAGGAAADDYMFLDEVREKVDAPISAEQAFKLGHVLEFKGSMQQLAVLTVVR